MKISICCMAILLTGCAHYETMVYMKDVQINNDTKNLSTPCEFYLNDRCIFLKTPTIRNPENPYNK